MDEIACRYIIARYVPRPLRDEGVNIGVLLQAPDKHYIACRFLDSFAKVKRVDPNADMRLLREFASAWKKALVGNTLFPSPEAEDRLGKLGPEDPSLLDVLASEYEGRFQFSEPRGTLATDVEDEIEDLYQQFVIAPAQPRRAISSVAIAPRIFRDKMIKIFNSDKLIEDGSVKAEFEIPGSVYPWIFDLGFKTSATHVIQALDLNIPEPETKMRRALIVKGMVEDGRMTTPDEPLKAFVVLQFPSPQNNSGFEASRQLLEQAKIEVLSIVDAAAMAKGISHASRDRASTSTF